MEARDLTHNLGGHWRNGRGQAPCPVCQSERRRNQRALSITEGDGKLLLYCFKGGCDFTQIASAAGLNLSAVQIDPLAQQQAAEKRRAYASEKLRKARDLWDYGAPISGTKGEAYFRSRGITCELPDSLRFVSDLMHKPSAKWCSAIVANIDPTGGVHRTFLSKDGVRLSSNAKMMLGPCAGGAVRLSDNATGPLVVCEGIETGLSLLSGLLSAPSTVWAALSTSGIKSLNLPSTPGKISIATDGDDAGQAAGESLATRASMLGWDVSLLPAPQDCDWNDVLIGRAAA